MLAACSNAIGSTVRGPEQPAAVLGVAAPALYLQAREAVLAVVTSDAVRLPCAVVMTRPSTEFSLREVPPDGFVTVGNGALRWISGGVAVEVEVVREWLPAWVRPVSVRADRAAELRAALDGRDIGITAALPSPVSLLGRGPGLTPSGDDVLAGYVLGCRAVGLPVPTLDGLHRTTALSGALLQHALAGDCAPQFAAAVAGLGSSDPLGPVLDALLAVGHTSGAALATGLLLAVGSVAAEAA